ncbi:MAG: GntR family transcriptional regulator [Gemmatimonadaceae bacterium]|nr:GntR family transcriptional regulator [Gemmatimonadaceae bacterium]
MDASPPDSITPSRRPLRAALRDELTARIISGRFAPGERLNESSIARELGVSQTPIREALLSLEGEAPIESDPRKGFRVLSLTPDEAEELYMLLGHFERLALRLQGRPAPKVLEELDGINARLATAEITPAEALEIDAKWHAMLLGDNPSRQLAGIIARLKQLLSRYQHAHTVKASHVVAAARQHRDIVRQLKNRKLKRAARLLKAHWLEGIEPMKKSLSRPAVRGTAADTSGRAAEPPGEPTSPSDEPSSSIVMEAALPASMEDGKPPAP